MQDQAASSAPDFGVAGKEILISGGSGGIGSALRDAFLAAGAKVTIADLRPAPADELPSGARSVLLDVRDDAAVEALAASIDRLDCVIHCAGRLIRHEEFRPEVFSDIVDIHLTGNLRLANAFRPHLRQTGGCLINIGSMYSYFGSPRIPAYAAAKTAVVSLTKSLALAFAEDGIRVNAIAPGWIETEISRGGREDADFNARVMARLPYGAWAKPHELAGTAVFLVSRASRLINGATIPVDGGYCAA